mgnify:CR=1 FL=1
MGFFDAFLGKLPIIGGVATGIGEWLGGRSQDKAMREALAQENTNRAAQEQAARDFLAQNMGMLTSPSTASQSGWSTGTSAMDQTSKERFDPYDAAQTASINKWIQQQLGYTMTPEERATRVSEAGQPFEEQQAAERNFIASRNLGPGAFIGSPASVARSRAMLREKNVAIPELVRGIQQGGAQAGMQQEQITGGRTTKTRGTTTTSGQTGGTSTQYDPMRAAQFMWDLQQPKGRVSTNTGYNPWASALGAGGPLAAQLSQVYSKKPPTSTWI